MSTRRTAISYSRFSDPKQGKGDSEDRQADMFRSFCQHHNLTPLRDVYADRGRSGYKDEHRRKGRLGQLIAEAKDGRFEPGSVIVVEAWDRLGRLIPNKQVRLIEELLETGVQIGVCHLNDIFTMEDFGTHKWTTLAVFIQLAYQESKQKAERVAASWVRRRKQVRENGEVLTGRLPSWLQVRGGEIVGIPERVAAVERIFQLSADGFGQARIIRTLNEEGFAPIGRGKNGWGHSYIQLILTDRRVLGELQLTKAGQPEGGLLPDYYPRIIDDDLFALANEGQRGRGGKHGNRDRKWVNAFQGLLVNALDGEGFFLHQKRERLMLESAAGANGRGKSATFPYDAFEQGVLGLLREVDPAEVLPKEPAENRATVLRAKLASVRGDIAGLQADLKEGYSKALASVLRDREADEEKIASELQEELERNAKPAARAWEELPSLADLIHEHGDEARLKIRGVLRSLAEQALVLLVRRDSWILAAVQFFFKGGAVRNYLLVYRQGCSGREGGWWCGSVVNDEPFPADDPEDDAPPVPPLDLRVKTDVLMLEEALASAPLDTKAESALLRLGLGAADVAVRDLAFRLMKGDSAKA
jgi:DNA invertase Pin-like site-specific DNA recombinase